MTTRNALILFLLVFIVTVSTCIICRKPTPRATVAYYVSAAGNDGNNGTSATTPFKTIAKINSVATTGNTVLFNGGDVFYGTIRPKANYITYGSYGTGKATISGATTLSTWTASGGGKYFASVNTSQYLNMLTVDGTPQIIARTPNADSAWGGYRVYNKVLSDTNRIRSVTGNPKVNGLMVIKTSNWRIEKVVITAVNHDTVKFKNWFYISNGSANPLDQPSNGYGYFLQGDTTYMDRYGEWVYVKASNRLYAYFGATNPNTLSVKISTLDTLFANASRIGTDVGNLNFEYGNLYGVFATSCYALNIHDNTFNNFGAQAIGFSQVYRASKITGNTIDNCMQVGIYVRNGTYFGLSIDNNNITDIGIYSGMGSFNQNDYTGISLYSADTINIRGNYVYNIGLSGIRWQGSNAKIKYNKVVKFNSVGQDQAGIYSFWDANDTRQYRNREVDSNFISYGVGTLDGSVDKTLRSSGIYMDGVSGYTKIIGNTIYSVPRSAVVCNCDTSITMTDNIIMLSDTSTHTAARGLGLQEGYVNNKIKVSNFVFKRNQIVILNTNQKDIYYTMQWLVGTISDNIARMGVFDSNYYNFPNATAFSTETYPGAASSGGGIIISINKNGWTAKTGQESHSIDMGVVRKDSFLLAQNWSPTPTQYQLTGTYKDVYNNIYTDSVLIGRYSSKLLIKATSAPPPPLVVTSTKSNVYCFGNNTGTITMVVSGGKKPYKFLWNDGNTDSLRTGLEAGNYSVTVTDAVGTKGYDTSTITEPGQIVVTTTYNAISDSSQVTTVLITATGGVLPYSGVGAFGAQGVGLHKYTVTDANQCSVQVDIIITVSKSAINNVLETKVKFHN